MYLHQTKKGSRGSLAEVWIDKENGLVKKYYKPNSITITGDGPYITDIEDIKKKYEAELYWSSKYPDFTLQTYEWGELEDEEGFYIIQEYGGDDLIHRFGRTINDLKRADIPNFSEQVLEMFRQFKQQNMYKFNNALCNMFYDPNTKKVKTIDFKYAKERHPDLRDHEIYSINEWISKIDKKLPELIIGDLV